MPAAAALTSPSPHVLESDLISSFPPLLKVQSSEMAFAREVADRILFMADEGILEENDPVNFFEHPQNDRLKEFLSKMI